MYKDYVLKPAEAQRALEQKQQEIKWTVECHIILILD